MKKIVLLATAALMMGAMFTSCQKEETAGPRVFHATMERPTGKQLLDGTQPQWVYYVDDESAQMMNAVFMYDINNNVTSYYPHRPAGVPSTQDMGTTADLMPIAGFTYGDFDTAAAAMAICGGYPVEILFGSIPEICGQGYVLLGMNPYTYGGADLPMAAQVGDGGNLYFRSITGMIDIYIDSSDIEDMRLDYIEITADSPMGGVYGVSFDEDGIPQLSASVFTENTTGSQVLARNFVGNHFGFAILPGTYSQFDIEFQFENPNSKDAESTHHIVKSLRTGNSITFTRNVITPVHFNLRAADMTLISAE